MLHSCIMHIQGSAYIYLTMLINKGNRTEWTPIQSVINQVI